MASQEHVFLSSSVLKEIGINHGNIEHLAPPVVVAALREKAKNGDGNGGNGADGIVIICY